MKTPISVSADQFDATVAEGVTLVDFWAPWCGPCQHQLQVLQQLGEQLEDDAEVTLAKVNIDDAPELAQRFGVRSIPTLLVMQNGDVETTFTGLTPVTKLRAAIDAVEATPVT